jgi:hypothetical protein
VKRRGGRRGAESGGEGRREMPGQERGRVMCVGEAGEGALAEEVVEEVVVVVVRLRVVTVRELGYPQGTLQN